MASLTADVDRRLIERGLELELAEWENVVPEGIEAVVPHRGVVADILYQLVGGLRLGMSYAGAEMIARLWEWAEFVQVTASGVRKVRGRTTSDRSNDLGPAIGPCGFRRGRELPLFSGGLEARVADDGRAQAFF